MMEFVRSAVSMYVRKTGVICGRSAARTRRRNGMFPTASSPAAGAAATMRHAAAAKGAEVRKQATSVIPAIQTKQRTTVRRTPIQPASRPQSGVVNSIAEPAEASMEALHAAQPQLEEVEGAIGEEHAPPRGPAEGDAPCDDEAPLADEPCDVDERIRRRRDDSRPGRPLRRDPAIVREHGEPAEEARHVRRPGTYCCIENAAERRTYHPGPGRREIALGLRADEVLLGDELHHVERDRDVEAGAAERARPHAADLSRHRQRDEAGRRQHEADGADLVEASPPDEACELGNEERCHQRQRARREIDEADVPRVLQDLVRLERNDGGEKGARHRLRART